MPIFVHIADERHLPSIQRSGLKLPRGRPQTSGARPVGVFALPITANFVVSHQWVRELKKRGFKVAAGVYFRIPDQEQVWAGVYNQEKLQVTAAEAAGFLAKEQVLGYEVIIPRSILASEIQAVRALPQTLGWRHFPDAHRKGIFCGCKFCMRGEIKSRRIQERYEQNAA